MNEQIAGGVGTMTQLLSMFSKPVKKLFIALAFSVVLLCRAFSATAGGEEDPSCSRESQHDETGHRRRDPDRPGVVEARIAGRARAGVLGPKNPMPEESDGSSDRGCENQRRADESPEWPH